MSGKHLISRITRWQDVVGGYTMASSLEASEDKSDGSGSADDTKDDNDGSPSDNEMSTWYTYPFVTRNKKRE